MSSLQFFVIEEDDQEESNFRIYSSKDTSKIIDGRFENIIPLSIQEEKEDDADEKEEDEYVSVSSTESEKPISLGGLSSSEVADDDEGFRTPTSLDHRIPVITQCPPAPMKTRPKPSTKRKEPSPTSSRSLHLDQSTELESMFPPQQLQNDSNPPNYFKKTHTDDDSD